MNCTCDCKEYGIPYSCDSCTRRSVEESIRYHVEIKRRAEAHAARDAAKAAWAAAHAARNAAWDVYLAACAEADKENL